MITVVRNLVGCHEVLSTLVWKHIALRHKQAHPGIAQVVIKPLILFFTLVRSFVGIDSSSVPCPRHTLETFPREPSSRTANIQSHWRLDGEIYHFL